jgi:serine protease Do
MKMSTLQRLKASILTGIVAITGLILGVLFASSWEWTATSDASGPGAVRALPGTMVGVEPASLPLTVDERGTSPFVAVAQRMLPAVVHIQVKTQLRSRGEAFGLGPEFREFFGMPDDRFHRDLRQTSSSGSGFIIDRDGTILTNNHVVENADEITVVLADKREVPAKVIGLDPETDLAVLQIELEIPADHVAPLGNSDDLRVGDWAIAIGNPYGLEQSLTVGVISATGRANLSISGGAPVFQNFIQTDASINFGNSGGPLMNIRGEVIGINTAINSRGQGIGFAIPMNMARQVVDDLKSRGSVQRGYLGMVPRELTADLRDALDLESGVRGIFVDSVQEGTPAAEGDLKAGDVVLEWDSHAIVDVADFRMRVAQTRPGEKVKARVIRDGKEKTLSFELADRAEALASGGQPQRSIPQAAPSDPLGLDVRVADDPTLLQRYGLNADLVAREGGVVIVGLRRDSPARGKLAEGDVITRIDRARILSVKDYREAVEKLAGDQRTVLVHIVRGERTTIEAVPLK